MFQKNEENNTTGPSTDLNLPKLKKKKEQIVTDNQSEALLNYLVNFREQPDLCSVGGSVRGSGREQSL